MGAVTQRAGSARPGPSAQDRPPSSSRRPPRSRPRGTPAPLPARWRPQPRVPGQQGTCQDRGRPDLGALTTPRALHRLSAATRLWRSSGGAASAVPGGPALPSRSGCGCRRAAAAAYAQRRGRGHGSHDNQPGPGRPPRLRESVLGPPRLRKRQGRASAVPGLLGNEVSGRGGKAAPAHKARPRLRSSGPSG